MAAATGRQCRQCGCRRKHTVCFRSRWSPVGASPVSRPPRRRPKNRARPPRLALELLESREVPTLNPFAPSPGEDGGEDDAFLEPSASVAQIKNPTNPVNVTPLSNDANVNTNAGESISRHNETSIAVNPTNPLNIVGSSNDVEYVVNPAGHVSAIGVSRVRYTLDGGKSWTAVALVSNEYNFTGDPALSFDANGTVYLATLGFRYNGGRSPTGIEPDVLVARSTDGGQTWSTQVRVATGTGSFFTPGRGQDKEFITA
jgi:hypothetical protein